MGLRGRGKQLRRFCLGASIAVLGLAAAAPAASANVEEIYVREVFAGGAHNDSYVEIQASVAGQYQVTGYTLTAYGVSGAVLGSATFQTDAVNSESQAVLLIADTSYAGSFAGGPAQNLTMPTLNLNPSGGAVCWEAFDCVAWGDFHGTTPSPTGLPAPAMTSSQFYVINRDIDRGCPTALDADDDTDVSFDDFSKQLPVPRNNASHIPEIPCEGPSSFIDTAPAKETVATSAEFTFHSYPAGAETECRLRGEPFTPCVGSKSYPVLAEGMHQFQIRSRNSPDPAGNPASYLWEIDLTPPTAKIENPPENPNPGPAVTFYFSASEQATFECSLAPVGEPDDYHACVTQKTYLHLDDGSYTFRVRATDTVGHVSAPVSYDFAVDSTLLDRIPPETTITSHPPPLVEGQTASFRYASSERESMFQCKLDGGDFEFCLPQGITYDHLTPGTHTFQVRARDEKANVDPTPADYTFSVAIGPSFDSLKVRADTRLTSTPGRKTRQRRPTFEFTSAAAGATFQCKLDGIAFFTRCRSPMKTRRLSYGRHRFEVRAVVDGIADPTPAAFGFKVIRGRRHR